MKPKRVLFRLTALALVLLVSGCVFMRLYKVQNQFQDFDRNFELGDEGGLTLTFLNPVLESDDIIWLMKNGPTTKRDGEESELWTYILKKQYLSTNDENGEFDIPLLMTMKEGMLTEVVFPERFLKYLSVPVLKRMFASMGNAEVNKFSKSASTEFMGASPDEIPKLEYITETLGKPYKIEESEETLKYTYLYYLDNAGPEAGASGFEFKTEFIFENTDETLKKAKVTIRGLSMALDFSSYQTASPKLELPVQN